MNLHENKKLHVIVQYMNPVSIENSTFPKNTNEFLCLKLIWHNILITIIGKINFKWKKWLRSRDIRTEMCAVLFIWWRCNEKWSAIQASLWLFLLISAHFFLALAWLIVLEQQQMNRLFLPTVTPFKRLLGTNSLAMHFCHLLVLFNELKWMQDCETSL